MSYILALVAVDVPKDDDAAWEAFEASCNLVDSVNPRFLDFCDLMQNQYPGFRIISDEELERETDGTEGAFSMRFGSECALLGVVDSRDEEMIPEIINFAHELKLSVFDIESHQIHRGDGFAGIKLDAEDEPYLMAPRLDQVQAVIDDMTVSDDTEYFSLQAANGSGAYVDGEDGIFALQWHEIGETGIRRWFAGHLCDSIVGDVAALTDRIRVMVRPNERLSKDDIAFILEALLHGSQRPDRYAWRDVTSDPD